MSNDLKVKISSYPSKLFTNTEYTFRFESPLVASYWATLTATYKGDNGSGHTITIFTKLKNITSKTWTPPRSIFENYIKNASSVPITFTLTAFYPTDDIPWSTYTVTSTLQADSYFNPSVTIDNSISLIKPFDPNTNKGIGNISGLSVKGNVTLKGNARLKYFFWRAMDSQGNTLKSVSKNVDSVSAIVRTSLDEIKPGTVSQIYFSILDSRGRAANVTKNNLSYEFINYTQPSIYDEDVQRGIYDEQTQEFTVDPDGVNVRVQGGIATDGNNLPTTITVVAKATGGGSTQTFSGIQSDTLNWTVLMSGSHPAEFTKDTGWELTFKAIDSITGGNYGVVPLEKVVLLRSSTFLINGTDGATGIAFGEAATEGYFTVTEDWKIKKNGVEEKDFVTNVTASGLLKEIDLLSGLGFKEGTSLNWQGAKIVKTENGTTSTERQDATYTENGYNVQEFLSGNKEKWKKRSSTQNSWTEFELVSGIKIAVMQFKLTGVIFTQYNSTPFYNSGDEVIDLPSFTPTEVFATLRDSIRWVKNARYDSSQNKIILNFSGPTANASGTDLTGSVVAIGGLS